MCIQTGLSELSVRRIKGPNLDPGSIKRPLLASADADEYDASVFLPSAAGLITLPGPGIRSHPSHPARAVDPADSDACLRPLQPLMGIIKKKLSVV